MDMILVLRYIGSVKELLKRGIRAIQLKGEFLKDSIIRGGT